MNVSPVYHGGSANNGSWPSAATIDTDEKAKVSSNDTTSGYLNGKLVAGTGVSLTENNDGGNETLTIANTVTNTDEKAKVSSNDTTSGYLNGKLIAGTGVSLTENNDGGNETLTIANTISAPTLYDYQFVTARLFALYEGSAIETNTEWATPEFKARGWSGVVQNDILTYFLASPSGWDLSSIAITTYWFMSSNSSADTHTFTSRGMALSNTNSFNTSFAFSETFSFTTDSNEDKLYIASVTCSPTNTPAAGDGICWKMKRTDSGSGTVFFLGAMFKFKLS